ncbi:MAG: glucose-1-phosphate thymidylyltransferase [Truepera sp.]|nr:glucose-1-phosphate thymidylyltransferase [Truepera sp.]
MKGLILAAGLGTRLRPLTSLRPKPIIAVANKPIIIHAIDNLVEAGIRQIGIVVSHDTIDYLKGTLNSYAQAELHYIMQAPPLGLAHAVQVSRGFLGDEPFVMYLGDNLFEHGITEFVTAFQPQQGMSAVLALVEVEDPRSLGVAVVEEGRIVRLVEKPQVPPSNLAVAGVYVFDPTIHRMIEGLKPGAKGEYQITDAIQRLIEHGGHVVPVKVSGWWKDTGNPEDILDANRLMLMKLTRRIEGGLEQAELIGPVVVEAGAVVRRSTVVGPAIIGPQAVVEDAYIGPFTSLGRGVIVRDAEVEYAVIEEASRLEAVRHRIRSSLIGAQVIVSGRSHRPSSHQLILGDKSRVEVQE